MHFLSFLKRNLNSSKTRLYPKKKVQNEIQNISSVEIKCDTNLQTEIELHPNTDKMKNMIQGLPPEILKSVSVEAFIDGAWKEIAKKDNNIHRLIQLNFATIKTDALRINLLETWGKESIKIFEVRTY